MVSKSVSVISHVREKLIPKDRNMEVRKTDETSAKLMGVEVSGYADGIGRGKVTETENR